jgi:metal-responsive CopG/Arc/MetJ family transcriptional regulator
MVAKKLVSKKSVKRNKPVVALTMSVELIARLDEMAQRCCVTRSAMVERLVRDAEMPRPKPAILPA